MGDLADEPATADEAAARAQAAQEQADQYRQFGAVAYKTGLVQRAEADVNRYCDKAEELATSPPVTVTTPDAEHYAQLADDYKQMGGVGYKTGLVQRAEADERHAEEAATATVQGPSQEGNPEGYSAASVNQYSTETPAACRK